MGRLDADQVVGDNGDMLRRLGEVPLAHSMPAPLLAPDPVKVPAWARLAAEQERPLQHVEPSVVLPHRGTGGGVGGGLERGRAIHKALERLASAPAERWNDVALETVSGFVTDAKLAQATAAEALRVRRDLLLSHLFGPGSYGEVPLRGFVELQDKTVDLAARLDRVVVGDRDVLIVEYKTDRVVPKTEAAIPPDYIAQLALYQLAVARLFPGKAVNCAILWTSEARLVALSSRTLERAVSQLDPHTGAT
jgi:ATP-dependent helicase/nuclease subunit A